MPLFRFSQVEVPWPLGPPDGRYLLRGGDGAATHVVVLATLGAQRRGRLSPRRRPAAPEPAPTPVPTGRATIVSAAEPLADAAAGRAWLHGAGEPELAADLAMLARLLDAQRAAAADPYLPPVGRAHLLVARIGFGDGEQVAHGRWSDARELVPARRSKRRMLDPSTRLAALLGGREALLACEPLALRARADVDAGRWRTGALQLQAALAAAVAELGAGSSAGQSDRGSTGQSNRGSAGQSDRGSTGQSGRGGAGGSGARDRVTELTARLSEIAPIAARALRDEPSAAERATLASALQRLEAALRAHTAR